jgi:hypothetical protein
LGTMKRFLQGCGMNRITQHRTRRPTNLPRYLAPIGSGRAGNGPLGGRYNQGMWPRPGQNSQQQRNVRPDLRRRTSLRREARRESTRGFGCCKVR